MEAKVRSYINEDVTDTSTKFCRAGTMSYRQQEHALMLDSVPSETLSPQYKNTPSPGLFMKACGMILDLITLLC